MDLVFVFLEQIFVFVRKNYIRKGKKNNSDPSISTGKINKDEKKYDLDTSIDIIDTNKRTNNLNISKNIIDVDKKQKTQIQT